MTDSQTTDRLALAGLLLSNPSGLTAARLAHLADLPHDRCKAGLRDLLRAEAVMVEPPDSPDGECLWYLEQIDEPAEVVMARAITLLKRRLGGAA